jgi:hypothetical protein
VKQKLKQKHKNIYVFFKQSGEQMMSQKYNRNQKKIKENNNNKNQGSQRPLSLPQQRLTTAPKTKNNTSLKPTLVTTFFLIQPKGELPRQLNNQKMICFLRELADTFKVK